MTTIQVYRNRRNSNKYIEVHNDGHYHKIEKTAVAKVTTKKVAYGGIEDD